MKLFIDRLIEKVKEKKSHICVGLDPHLDLLPSFLVDNSGGKVEKKTVLGKAIVSFNREIIDNITDIAVAIKPQIAFYERLGTCGLSALEDTVAYARKKDLIVILDCKRNDIGSTAVAYADAYLNEKSINSGIIADALTINPYLGFDGVSPFIERKTRGAFALVRTSNPSAVDLQDLKINNGKKLFQKTGELISEWGTDVLGNYGYSNLGAVIGATYPEELKLLRQEMPHTYFLIPGYGAQGGQADDVVCGFNEDKLGSIINSARGIIFAYRREPWQQKYSEREFGKAARAAAVKMRDSINCALE